MSIRTRPATPEYRNGYDGVDWKKASWKKKVQKNIPDKKVKSKRKKMA